MSEAKKKAKKKDPNATARSTGKSRANANKEIRVEALREQLKNKGLIQQVIETAEKLSNLDKGLDSVQVQRLRAANDARLKLVNLYMPALKQVELSNAEGETFKTSSSFNFIPVGSDH